MFRRSALGGKGEARTRLDFDDVWYADPCLLQISVSITKYLFQVAGSAVEAGTDSTAASLIWFIMAVILYPETLENAQKEVDSVVGAAGTAMPTFANVNDLPYCFALVKEVLR